MGAGDGDRAVALQQRRQRLRALDHGDALLPGVFVPLPSGNGEQALNAGPLVEAGAALLVEDAALDADYLTGTVLPLVTDAPRLVRMSSALRGLGRADADTELAQLVLGAVR